MTKIIHVAVGVIISPNEQDKTEYFLTKRLSDAHQGGKWEFPGGKVENDESVAQALARELKEEIAIDVLTCQPLITINHTYNESDGTDKKVCLDVFVVDNYTGEPSAQEGQGEGWFLLDDLKQLDFPKANQAIIEALIARQI
jgi:8-oxo-dGTP diphosphatase